MSTARAVGDIVIVDGQRHVVTRVDGLTGAVSTMAEQEYIDRNTLDAATMMSIRERRERDRARTEPSKS